MHLEELNFIILKINMNAVQEFIDHAYNHNMNNHNLKGGKRNMNTNEQTNIPEFTDADKRESTFHNFDVKDEVAGKLIKIEEGSYGPQYVIETPEGDITVGSYNVLERKIRESDIGKFIKVKLLGNVLSPKTKRTYKNFEVFIK